MTAAPAASLLPAGGRALDQDRAWLLAQALAPGAADVKVLTLPGPPASKARPRFAKGGATYKDRADAAAEQATAWRLRRNFPQPWSGNLALGVVFFRPDRQRIDADNMVKHICDAGNGIAWDDDAQITATYSVVELDPDDPRTLLVVTRHVSSLDRNPQPLRARRSRRRTVDPSASREAGRSAVDAEWGAAPCSG
ncbi:RusA family crossover junction endodeoxyribonuclease [Streptomycetaceae bacterium NBC_01309]